jgi:hypothetical protein
VRGPPKREEMKPFIFSLYSKHVSLLQFCKGINKKSGKIIKVAKK